MRPASFSPSPATTHYVRPADVDQRSTFGQRFGWALEGLAWDWAYWGPMKALPIARASNAGAALLRRLGPATKVHQRVVNNLRLAFPDWTGKQIADTARGAWDNLGRIAGELPHLSRMRPYASDHIEVVGAERLDRLRDCGQPAVLFSGHLANWELMLPAICQRGVSCVTAYRPLNNPHVDRRLSDARFAAGATGFAPKGAGTRELVRALANRQSIAILADQKYGNGVSVPFFGHEAMTAPGPARLARRFGAPLLPLSILRTGPARYRVTIHEPFPADADPDEDRAVYNTLLRINHFLEDRIREAPEQWFWMHRRWPKDAWARAGA